VLDVLAPMHGEIVVDDTGRHVNVMQQELETYVPKAPGTRVRAVACSFGAWRYQQWQAGSHVCVLAAPRCRLFSRLFTMRGVSAADARRSLQAVPI
jgi:hypothetical protein